MITDKLLTLATKDDGTITQTRAVCLAQADLKAPTNGIAPYQGLWLTVRAYDAAENLTVTLEHCDTADGTYETLLAFPAVSADIGELIAKAPIPFGSKNWLRLAFNKGARVNAILTAGVDKGVLEDD